MNEIKVGDTVRVKVGSLSARAGEEFSVTEIINQKNPHRGVSGFDWYATGDSLGYGAWGQFLELVKSGADDPRWRYNDHIVVYPETRDANGPGRGVTVLNETPLPKIYTRWENQFYADQTRFDEEITEAARAYWEAHPLPKPAWHTPGSGEVWELTVNGDTGPFVVVYNPWALGYAEYQFRAGNGTTIDYMSDEITAGRRIYPEPTA